MPVQPSAIDQVFRHWDPTWVSKPHHLVKAMPVVVNVQNVSDYSSALAEERKRLPRIGRCFSPWPQCLLFWQEPTTDAGIAYKACLIAQTPVTAEMTATIHGLVFQRESMGGPWTILSGGFVVTIPEGGLLEEDEEGHQMMNLDIVGHHSHEHPNYAFIRGLAERIASPLHFEMLTVAARAKKDWIIDTQKDMQVALCAFSFAHCRNVQVVEHGTTSPPPRWRKEGVPLVRYRVVKIDGRTVKRAGETQAETDRHMGMHICRGHFKHFTADKPLLGKHVGTYWWPQHTRGAQEHGVIEKTYQVET